MSNRAGWSAVLLMVSGQLLGQQPSPTPSHITGGISAPTLLRGSKVPFPEKCRGSRFRLDDGAFLFEATVAESGDVTEVKTLKAPHLDPPCPDLEQAYRKAISGWKYEPAKLKGKPVPLYLGITTMLEPR